MNSEGRSCCSIHLVLSLLTQKLEFLNQSFPACFGFGVLWVVSQFRCGITGDARADQIPRFAVVIGTCPMKSSSVVPQQCVSNNPIVAVDP